MPHRYVYSYYLNDLLVCDRNSILTILQRNMIPYYLNVVEGHEANYKHVIALGMARDREDVDRILNEVRKIFTEYNELLDKYHVNEEMRFDVNDLPDAVGFYRLLFAFMPEEDCEKALERMRAGKRSAKKS